MKCGAKVPVESESAILHSNSKTTSRNLPQKTIKPKDEPIKVENYVIAYKAIDLHDPPTLFFLLIFFWPIPILLFDCFGRPAKLISVLKILEPIGCFCSGYIIIWATFIFGDALFAGYMATASIVCYFLVSFFDAGLIIKDSMNKRRTKAFT
jgi:hypothetical protein